nr:phage tail protein [Sporosarcina sp. ACRSL]
MIVTHIDGRSEFLTDYKSLQIKERVNGEYSLSFLLFKTERNEHSFSLAVEESIIEYDGQQYRIKKLAEKVIGKTPVKQIQADHTFFDLVDVYQYDTISGAKQLSVCLAHALTGTGYTFEVIDSFSSVTFENYGDDNALALIQTALNRFGAEIEINKKHLRFRRQIGRKTDIQFRYGYNIKTLDLNVDSSNLSTYIRGYGKQNEDGSYAASAEYTSPLASIYGIRHAKPVRDERYTTYAGLLQRLQNDLQDIPEVSITLEAVELEKAGIDTEKIELGDDIFTIYEPLNIDINARIVERIRFPEEPTPNRFTIANVRGSVVDSIADFQRTKDRIDGIFEGKEKLPFNVLDDAVQRATQALQSAQTQIKFENGFLAIDPTNPNRMVLINSKGIGISKNGGASFTEAITADGFVLSAGAIGQLSANNINVTGMIHAINNEGSTTIDGGKITTNSIDVEKLIAGHLTGFTIQTDYLPQNPRIVLNKSSFQAANGSNRITMNPAEWTDHAKFGIVTNNNSLSIQLYDSRSVISNNVGQLEIWAINGGVGVVGDFNVQGSKNASVSTSQGMVNVSAYETAEYYFGDIGRGEVTDGECVIHIDSLFAETVNTDIQYEVFLTPYGKGQIYVDPDGMTPDSFTVKGDDIPFAYEIKAKRKGYEDVRLEVTYESEGESVAY